MCPILSSSLPSSGIQVLSRRSLPSSGSRASALSPALASVAPSLSDDDDDSSEEEPIIENGKLRPKRERQKTFWVNRKSVEDWTTYYERGPGYKAAILEAVALLRDGKHLKTVIQHLGWSEARLRDALVQEGYSLHRLQYEGRLSNGHRKRSQARRQHQEHDHLSPHEPVSGHRGEWEDGRDRDEPHGDQLSEGLRHVRQGDRGVLRQDRRPPGAPSASGARQGEGQREHHLLGRYDPEAFRGEEDVFDDLFAPGDVFEEPLGHKKGFSYRIVAVLKTGFECQVRRGKVGRFTVQTVIFLATKLKTMRRVK